MKIWVSSWETLCAVLLAARVPSGVMAVAQWHLFCPQSASQPRLSHAEMSEDYPRYPDIHDLDLTLLNPRMIVVRDAMSQCFPIHALGHSQA